MSKSLPTVDSSELARCAVDFDETLAAHGLELRAERVATLQVNVGKLCNQACRHCHVDAGPKRTEIMAAETAEKVLAAVHRCRIRVLDITGGAPELNPSFRRLVTGARAEGAHVMVRHNLTVMFEPGQEDLPEFFREHGVEVVSSLPCYLEENVDTQRGKGVYARSIEALHRLNAVGYGVEGSGLELHLVYNPVGPHLPPPQDALERDYKRELAERWGIVFNRLLTITNMPIRRFLGDLRRKGKEEVYMEKLVAAFNPATVPGLMCRSLVSVDWTGRLYDCDFNQMLELGVGPELGQTIDELDPARFATRRIATAAHCFGCTAGAGSSCGGAVA
jgi:radical SAM/Cys-rich protein